MKKLHFLTLLLALICFSACSDNDDPQNPVDLAQTAKGTYHGYTVANAAYFSNMVADNQTILITPAEENKVNISFVSDTWGTFTINGATLSASGTVINIAGSGKTQMGMDGNINQYDCTIAGTLVGGELSLTFTVPSVMRGLTIQFKQGDIPSEIVIPGTYEGYTIASCPYFPSPMTAGDQSIVVTRNSDGTYKVAYTSETWGEFIIENAQATYDNGKFSLAGAGTTKMGMDGNIKEYNCNLSGSIDPAKDDPTFTFSVPTVMNGLSIVFHKGNLPDSEE